MAELTAEQKALLLLMGKPDDGSQHHLIVDGERITRELIDLGLVYRAGRKSFDLTDEGERTYAQLSGTHKG